MSPVVIVLLFPFRRFPFRLFAHAAVLLRRRADRARLALDAGMTTAEYAVGTVAAVAFAVVLYKVVRSPAVSATLSSIVRSALHAL
ncbi:DUF4244 domain-containing protein [uncultured Jatrophihabitans sp.]|uniref:DUF4244 domain-containing protein n=1 Tax=uncultured Jatrophihabitans sp. TaxID=1610747 RepID=UPI0035CA0DE8